MVDRNKWMADAKARLAIQQEHTHRVNSVAERVAALRPEIEAARAAGKGWRQIASDLCGSGEVQPDTVRIAFARGGKVKCAAAPVSREVKAKATGAAAKAPSKRPVDDSLTEDMFAPMFDARDTRGRCAEDTADREVLL